MQDPGHNTRVMGVVKMENIAPRMGIKPTSLAFQARVVTVTPPGLPDVITVLIPTCLCSSLPERYTITLMLDSQMTTALW